MASRRPVTFPSDRAPGCRLPAQLARDAHAACPDRVIIEWVIACTAAGPVLVSASECPDVERLQQVHRQSIGESPLGEHLAAYLRILEDGAVALPAR